MVGTRRPFPYATGDKNKYENKGNGGPGTEDVHDDMVDVN
jgi:hypothetical protein